MANQSTTDESLKIIHVLRAPLGGLFRHVLDLTREQIARGHQVGIITDSIAGGEAAENILADLAPQLSLGVLRLPIPRNPSISDLSNLAAIVKHCRKLEPQIVHGHGSKGGLFARLPGFLPGGRQPVRVYTPHGGSFNYHPGSWLHKIYMLAEKILERRTDIFLFESAFIHSCFTRYVGETHKISKVVLNGISDAEFAPIVPDSDAADFVYVGELRAAKGIDTLIAALAELKSNRGRTYHAILVGSGPDQDALTEQARALGIGDQISFPGAMKARDAFRSGRAMVVPSRAESLPYVVLEAAGAQVPLISTNVGGIPEIFGPFQDRLIACNDKTILADALQVMVEKPDAERQKEAADLRHFVESKFHVEAMADAAIDGYRQALAGKAHFPQPAKPVEHSKTAEPV